MTTNEPLVLPPHRYVFRPLMVSGTLLVVFVVCAWGAHAAGDRFWLLFAMSSVGLVVAMALLSRSWRHGLGMSSLRLGDGWFEIEPHEGEPARCPTSKVSRVMFDRGRRFPHVSGQVGINVWKPPELPMVLWFGEPSDDSRRLAIIGERMTRFARWLEQPDSPERGHVVGGVELAILGRKDVVDAERTLADWCGAHGIAFDVRKGWGWRLP